LSAARDDGFPKSKDVRTVPRVEPVSEKDKISVSTTVLKELKGIVTRLTDSEIAELRDVLRETTE